MTFIKALLSKALNKINVLINKKKKIIIINIIRYKLSKRRRIL